MSLKMFIILLIIVSLAGFLYRRRTIEDREAAEIPELTAASITTIEAAFLRAGWDGVEQFRAAAAQCGAQLDDVDVTAVEAGLAGRGFMFSADVRRKMRNARIAAYLMTVPAALATAMYDAARRGSSRHELWAALTEFAILGCGAVIAVTAVAHVGSSTKLGREALAMRQAAYPLRLLRDADPTATVAHYGGTMRRRTKEVAELGDGGDDGYVWAADARTGSHGHDSGSGGHSSHGCASSCASGGCSGH